MTRTLAIALIFLASCGGSAYAPPVKDVRFIVRIAYIHDLEIKPHETMKGCEIPRRFADKELPEMPGYVKVVRCLPVGNVK